MLLNINYSLAVITTTLVDRMDAVIPMYTETFNKSVTRLIN